MTKMALSLRTFYFVVLDGDLQSDVGNFFDASSYLIILHGKFSIKAILPPPPPHKSIFTAKIIYLKTELSMEYGNMA